MLFWHIFIITFIHFFVCISHYLLQHCFTKHYHRVYYHMVYQGHVYILCILLDFLCQSTIFLAHIVWQLKCLFSKKRWKGTFLLSTEQWFVCKYRGNIRYIQNGKRVVWIVSYKIFLVIITYISSLLPYSMFMLLYYRIPDFSVPFLLNRILT